MHHLRSVLPYVRPYRPVVALGMAMVVLANIFGTISPWLIGAAIDSLERPETTPLSLLAHAGLIVLVALAAGSARFGMRQLLNSVTRRIETDLRNDFFAQLMRLDAGFYGRTPTGDLMSRATNDTQAVRQAIGPGIMYLVNTIVSTAFSLAVMVHYSVRLTLITLVPLLLLPVAMKYFGDIIHERFDRIQDHFGVLSTFVQENLSGVRIVRAYTQERAQAQEFDALNRTYLDRNMALARTSATFHATLGLLTGLGLLAVLWFGSRLVMAGQLTKGEFVSFNFYLVLLVWPMIALGWVANLFQRGAASMARINRIMAAVPAIREATDAIVLADIRGRIELRNVWFRYPDTERWVLEDVSFIVEPGQTAALVGPTGAGKSTVIALLTRRYDPTRGAILLDDVPIDRLPLAQLRAALGVVPQDAFVFSDTVANNIALGLPADAPRAQRLAWATAVAQLTDTLALLPRGIDTRLGERGVNVSGGQRQRITLARAIAHEPHVLLLDDALSAVDTHTEEAILRGLRNVLHQRTSIIVSHRVTAVMGAAVILVLADGRIVERGRHVDLLATGGVYHQLLRRQLLEEGLDGEPLAARSGAI